MEVRQHDQLFDAHGDTGSHEYSDQVNPVWPITKQFEQLVMSQLEAKPCNAFRIIFGEELLSKLLLHRPLLLSTILAALARVQSSAAAVQIDEVFHFLTRKACEDSLVLQINEVIATLLKRELLVTSTVALHEQCIATMSLSQTNINEWLDPCLAQVLRLKIHHSHPP
eukprot:Blabericola_migrator_1__11226@NODE_659_length_7014_cov_89_107672_g36_i1_p5_GENE_NODE_659_length_7014_cov_89_107672_g36_i1NODE_659_length_7014_cov_89_107672_g36_i1_p5_ORF_typecomplete_len168_score15_69_NODE_659_length_7014_cov_89_107672_g36_i166569